MAKTVLLTLGRLPKALELARSLSEAGCRVIVAEPFAWHVCRISRSVSKSYRVAAPNTDPEQYACDLARIIEQERVDIVVPISEEAIHAMAARDRVSADVRFYSPPRDMLMQLHDKLSFAHIARTEGLHVPPTVSLDDPRAVSLDQAQRVVVKPTHACAGIGLRILDTGDRLPNAADIGPAIVQGFVDGRHLSSFSIAEQGRLLGTVVYEGTVFSGTVAICFQRVEQPAEMSEHIERLVHRLQFSGFIAFDFIVDADQRPWVIECNPRLTSGVHFIEHEDLALAVLEPERVKTLRIRPERLFQQFYTVLTETQKAMFDRRRFAPYLAQLRRARDVVWQRHDPLPFLLMTPVCYQMLARTIFKGESFGEAATRDIAWFGDIDGSSPDTERGPASTPDKDEPGRDGMQGRPAAAMVEGIDPDPVRNDTAPGK
ncbi:MAG: ATP-grasp domain-containing protein [Chromatiales bacterium]|jgi:hypothetical protein